MFPKTAENDLVASRMQLCQDVRRRVLVDNQVTFEESGRAFALALKHLDEAETRAFIHDAMPNVVDIFLNQNPSVVSPNLLIHFEDVLRSAARVVSHEVCVERNVQHVDVLARILDEASPMYQDRKAMLPGGRKMITIRATVIKDLAADGTFPQLLALMQQNGNAVVLSAKALAGILQAVLNCKLPDAMRLAFADAALAILQRFLQQPGEDAAAAFALKKQKAEDLHDIHLALLSIYQTTLNGNEEYFALSLQLWLKCFETDNFVLKRYGLDQLIRVCVDAARNRGQAAAAATTSLPNSRWDDGAICRWLVQQRQVLDAIFGSQNSTTHSALIGRSKSLLEHMATAGALGPEQIDFIFSKVGERRQHEADSGAVQSLLAELVLDLANSQVSLLILSRAVLRCDDMYAFARKLTEHSNRTRGVFKHELQVHILELLWCMLRSDTLAAADTDVAEERRKQILLDFSDALRNAIVPVNFTSSKQDEVFNDYLGKSLDVLREEGDGEVWAVCSVLQDLILLHPANTSQAPSRPSSSQGSMEVWRSQQKQPEWTKQSQTEFVASLDPRLLDWLVYHVCAQKRNQGVILDLLKLVIEQRQQGECTFALLERVWNAAPARRLGWFQTLVLPPDLRFAVFTELLCKKQSVVELSQQGFDCFAAYFQECEIGLDTLWRIAIETKQAAVATKASQMLLATQQCYETGFLPRVLQALAQRVSSPSLAEERQRCIELANSFLESQLVLAPHLRGSGGSASASGEFTVHHDGVLTYSNLDLGKAVEKRFKEGSRGFTWCPGYIYEYAPDTRMHTVWLKDGIRTYNFEDLSHEGALHATEKQYRALSIADGRHEVSVDPPMPQVMDALRRYEPVRLDGVIMENCTVREMKAMVLDRLGRPSNLSLENTEMQIDLGNAVRSLVLPQCVVARGAHRVAVCDESLPVSALMSKFGARWFLSPLLRPHTSPTQPQQHSDEAFYIDAQYFDLLMRLATTTIASLDSANAAAAGLVDKTRQECWRLLMSLPTPPDLLARTRTDSFDWAFELESSGERVLAKVYLLQIAEEMSTETASLFSPRVADILLHLFYQTLQQRQVQQQEEDGDWEQSIVLQVLLRLMRKFAQRGLLLPSRSADNCKLAKQLTHLLSLPLVAQDLTVCLDALFIQSLLADADASTHLPMLLLDDDLGKSLVDVLAASPHDQIQQKIGALLLGPIFSTNHQAVFAAILTTLERSTPLPAAFSRFIIAFVQAAAAARSASEEASCRDALMPIVRRKLLERDASYLELCQFLVDGAPCVGEDAALVRSVLAILLSRDARPFVTREQCFALLTSLARDTANLHVMELVLQDFFAPMPAPMLLAHSGSRTWDFHFSAPELRDSDSSSTKHVGLINQGATCYQNSVLQQLFMRPAVRKLVLSTVTVLRAGEEQEAAAGKVALLQELQRTLAFLQGSQQRYFNPLGFVMASSALRLTDGHLSQNDCAEFFTLLIDNLEECVPKHARERLRALFFSTMTSLTMRTCPEKHESERSESTLYIPLSIRYGVEGRALNSLDEALDEWSRAEHLTELICEECKASQRFDGDQVKFISTFPPILVLQLKRFDFDYETFQPFKLNHRVSFKQRLDMGRFSRDAVLKQYTGVQREEEETPIWYRLKGVVVHQGTGASFGHYYSFIEDADHEWFRFDDDRVTRFDFELLEEECFGGQASQQDNTAGGGKKPFARNNNAYMLFYEKEECAVAAPLPQTTAAPLSLRMAAKLVHVLLAWRKRVAAEQALLRDAKNTVLDASKAYDEVKADNERNTRHCIAFAPDLLAFCRRILLPRATTAEFALTSFTKLALFAASEKDELDVWLAGIPRELNDEESVRLTLDMFVAEGWLERLLMLPGADVKSSRAFTSLLLLLIGNATKLDLAFTHALLALFPKTIADVFRLVDGNYFDVLTALATRLDGDARVLMRDGDIVLRLIRFVDAASAGGEQAVREARLCNKIVHLLDALLVVEDEQAPGFPLLSQDTCRALFADSFLNFLLHFTPGAAAHRLVPKLCECSVQRVERALDAGLHQLSSSQWVSKAADAPVLIPDACALLQSLLLSIADGPESFRACRETALAHLVKLAKDTRRVAADRKDANLGDRRDAQHSSALLLLSHLLQLFNALVLGSDVYRSALKHASHKYPSLVCAVDAHSFEGGGDGGGNAQCALREERVGRIVRTGATLSVALGHLPRPILLPSYTLSIRVEDAGSTACNGTYQFDGFFPARFAEQQEVMVDPSAPKFTRVDEASGKRFTIFRTAAANMNDKGTWLLAEFVPAAAAAASSVTMIDYYQTRDLGGLPDAARWQVCGAGGGAAGQKPAPRNVSHLRTMLAPDSI